MSVVSICMKGLMAVLFGVLAFGYTHEDNGLWVVLPAVGIAMAFTTAFVLAARRRGIGDAIDELLHGGYLEKPLRDGGPADVQLTRSPDDKHRYSLAAHGVLSDVAAGWGVYGELSDLAGSWSATAESGDQRWHLTREDATDAAGTVVGSLESRFFSVSGPLVWKGRELWLQVDDDSWLPGGCPKAELADGDRELATFVGSRYRSAPLRVTVRDESIDRGLLLFATFLAWDKTRPRSGE